MDLAGFNIQVGKLFALKVIVGTERSHDDRDKHSESKKDSYATDQALYRGGHSTPELANDRMLSYDSRGTSSIPAIPPGSCLKIYI